MGLPVSHHFTVLSAIQFSQKVISSSDFQDENWPEKPGRVL
jgi:hypothetical protein